MFRKASLVYNLYVQLHTSTCKIHVATPFAASVPCFHSFLCFDYFCNGLSRIPQPKKEPSLFQYRTIIHRTWKFDFDFALPLSLKIFVWLLAMNRRETSPGAAYAHAIFGCHEMDSCRTNATSVKDKGAGS